MSFCLFLGDSCGYDTEVLVTCSLNILFLNEKMQLKLDQRYQHVIKKLETYKTEQTRFHEHTQYRLNSSYLSIPFHRILNLSLTHTS